MLESVSHDADIRYYVTKRKVRTFWLVLNLVLTEGNIEPYKTVRERSVAEIVVKKSRFIACLGHVATEEEADAFREEARGRHRMAKHNAYAYVLHERGQLGYSDDGEPSKTASLPMVETMLGAGLRDVMVVVTRYFGGTLLGKGGLVRAYTQAVQAAIDNAELVTMSCCFEVDLRIPYADFGRAVHLAELAGAKVLHTEFGSDLAMTLLVPIEAWRPVEKLAKLLQRTEEVCTRPPYWTEF